LETPSINGGLRGTPISSRLSQPCPWLHWVAGAAQSPTVEMEIGTLDSIHVVKPINHPYKL